MIDDDQILPNLTELSLSGKDVKMILQADFPQHLFGSLKLLQTVDDDSTCFPLDLLERFHNLETLIRRRCSCEKVFSNGGYLKKHARKFTMIKHLHLHKFNHLKQLWKQDSKLDSFVQCLEILNVHYCQNLLILSSLLLIL